jgi:hypothetical protein
MWPFAKLPNGFGSHCSYYLVFKLASPFRYGIRLNYMYIYSPILLDSQELILFYLSTRCSCPRWWCQSLHYTTENDWPLPMEWRLPAQLPWQLQVQHVSLILQRSVGFHQWNGDGVAPATPGALRTRIPDAGKRAWFSVMEVDWRASRFRCGTSLTLYVPCGIGLR